MADKAKRGVSPFIASIRDLLLGRERSNYLRYPEELSRHPQDAEPNIPQGSHHKLADNYYFTRNARGEVGPPTMVADNTRETPWFLHTKLSGDIEEVGMNTEEGSLAHLHYYHHVPPTKRTTPGEVYRYSQFGPQAP